MQEHSQDIHSFILQSNLVLCQRFPAETSSIVRDGVSGRAEEMKELKHLLRNRRLRRTMANRDISPINHASFGVLDPRPLKCHESPNV